MKRFGRFIASVFEEMKIVTWPTKKQLGKDFLTVIQTTIIFAIYFGVIDFAITKLLNILL